jgi:hypothetical protein
MPISAFPLGKAKVNKNSTGVLRVVKEVGRFDVAMENLLRVNRAQGGEKTAKVLAYVWNGHVTVVLAKVAMLTIWEDGDDLVQMTKGGDKRAHLVRVLQVMEQLELVEYTHRAARDIYLFDGNIVGSVGGLPMMPWRGPFSVFTLVNIPAVFILVVLEVLCFVHSRECA